MTLPGLKGLQQDMQSALVDIAGYLDSEFGTVIMDDAWNDERIPTFVDALAVSYGFDPRESVRMRLSVV